MLLDPLFIEPYMSPFRLHMHVYLQWRTSHYSTNSKIVYGRLLWKLTAGFGHPHSHNIRIQFLGGILLLVSEYV